MTSRAIQDRGHHRIFSVFPRLHAQVLLFFLCCVHAVSLRQIIVSIESNFTLESALGNLAPGDVIEIAPGRYTGDGFCKLRISVHNVTLRGHSPELTEIDCFGSGGRHLYIDAPDVRVERIHFSNGTCFGDANCPGPGDGGSLLVNKPNVMISNCKFTANQASEHGGAISISNAAGFTFLERLQVELSYSVRGGAVWSQSSSVRIVDSTFTDNIAEAFGGAVYVYLGTLTMENCNCSGGFAYWWGGALFNPMGTIVVHGGTFSNNYAYWGGAVASSMGGSSHVVGARFWRNSAVEGGALIGCWDASLSVIDSVFVENTASHGGGAIYNGAIWRTGEGANALATLTVRGHSRFERNAAVETGGAISAESRCETLVSGNVVFENNTAQMDGGAIFGFFSPRIHIEEHVVLSNNMAFVSGGAIGVKTWETILGSPPGPYPPIIVITGQVQCWGNQARSGGCLWVSDSATADLSGDTLIDSNSASVGGGASVDLDASLVVSGRVQWSSNSAREGGAIKVASLGVVVNVSGSVWFNDNRADMLGGGVSVGAGVLLRVSEAAAFDNNSAGVAGAAVFGRHQGAVALLGSSISMRGNRAPSGQQWDSQTGDRCGDGVLVGPGGMVPQTRPGVDNYGGQVTYCDDGNLEPGDGCSAECSVEPGWVCSYGSPEQPDDCILATCGDGISHQSAIPDTAFGNGKANNYPMSCSAYREATGVRQDGEYWLFVSGHATSPILVYCHGMEGASPQEFITLANPESNWVYWSLPSEAGDVPARKNHFEKLRVKFHKGRVHVNVRDFTFTDGLKEHVNSDWYQAKTGITNQWDIRSPTYGGALSCDGRENSARMDLTGLPLRVSMSNFLSAPGDYLASSFWSDSDDLGNRLSRLGDWGEGMKTFYGATGGWCTSFGWDEKTLGHCIHSELDNDGSNLFCLALEYEPTVLPRTCDDGNTESGDGCSASCTPEAGFVCSGAGSDDGDVCTCACGPGRCDHDVCITPDSKPTLPEAVAAAGEGDKIYLSAGRFPAVNCGAVALVSSLTIQGQGSRLTEVNCKDFGSSARRPFLTAHAANLRVQGIAISNAVSVTDGAAIAILPSKFVLIDGQEILDSSRQLQKRRSERESFALPVKNAEKLGWKYQGHNVSMSLSFFVNVEGSNVWTNAQYDALLFRYNGTGESGIRYELTVRRRRASTPTSHVSPGAKGTAALLCSLSQQRLGPSGWMNAEQVTFVSIDLSTQEWHHLTMVLQSPTLIFNSSDMKPSRMEVYLGSVLAGFSIADPARGFPSTFDPHARIGDPRSESQIDPMVELGGLYLWSRRLTTDEINFLSLVVGPGRMVQPLDPKVDRGILDVSKDPLLSSDLLLSVASPYTSRQLQPHEQLDLAGSQDTWSFKVEAIGEEISLALWVKVAAGAQDQTLLEMSRDDDTEFPFSKGILLTLTDELRVRYRLWQDVSQYPWYWWSESEGTHRNRCHRYETELSADWFVDSRDPVPAEAWVHVAVVHDAENGAQIFFDGAVQQSRRMPLPEVALRDTVLLGRSSELILSEKRFWHWQVGSYDYQEMQVTPKLFVKTRFMNIATADPGDLDINPDLLRSRFGFIASQHEMTCVNQSFSLDGSLASVLIFNHSLSALSVLALSRSELDHSSLFPPPVPLVTRSVLTASLEDVHISFSACLGCRGGGIHMQGLGFVEIFSSAVVNCSAVQGGGVSIHSGAGGAMFAALHDTILRGNAATKEGGGLAYDGNNVTWPWLFSFALDRPSVPLLLRRCEIVSNAAVSGAGAQLSGMAGGSFFREIFRASSSNWGPNIMFFVTDDPQWIYMSLSNKRLIGLDHSDQRGLIRYNVVTGQREVVLDWFHGMNKPVLSPDKQTVYWSGGASKDEAVDAIGIGAHQAVSPGLYTLHLPTLQVRKLGNQTRGGLKCSAPTPDGDVLYFASESEIWRMNLHTLEEEWFCGATGHDAAQSTRGNCQGIRFEKISDMTMHGDGDRLFVCDQDRHQIFQIDVQTGSIDVLAGSGDWEHLPADGIGVAAHLVQPASISWRRDVLYVLDVSTIRQIELHSRQVTTVYNFTSHFKLQEDWTTVEFRSGPVDVSQISNVSPVIDDWKADVNAYLVATDDGRICATFYTRARDEAEEQWAHNVIGCLTPRGNQVEIGSTAFHMNRATEVGGALSVIDASPRTEHRVRDCQFIGNSAGNGGGAIHMSHHQGSVQFDGCEWVGNSAKEQGGAMEVAGASKVEVLRGVLRGNSAARGAALAVTSNAPVTDAEILAWFRSQFQATPSHISLHSTSISNHAADFGAVSVKGELSRLVLWDCAFDSNLGRQCGGALHIQSGLPVLVGGVLNFTRNVGDVDGGSVCIQQMESEESRCTTALEQHPFLLQPASDVARIWFSSGAATRAGASLYVDCETERSGATGVLGSRVVGGASLPSVTWTSGAGRRQVELRFEGSSAGYGPAVASTAHAWELVGQARELRLSAGQLAPLAVRLFDVFGQTVRSQSGHIPLTVRLRMCVGELCSPTNQYESLVAVFESSGFLDFEHIEGSAVLMPTSAAGATARVRLELDALDTKYRVHLPALGVNIEFGAVPRGHHLVLRRKWNGMPLMAAEHCAENQYVMPGEWNACHKCPTGAVCSDGELHTEGGLDGKGGRWEPHADGRYYLKACPVGYRLVDATEKGYEGQECVECGDGEFIVNSTSSAFQCHKCPPTANGCPGKGPPVFSRLVRGSVVARSASGDGTWNQGLRISMASRLAQSLQLDASMVTFSAVCNSTDTACHVRDTLRRAEELEQDPDADDKASRFWVLSFSVHLPRDGRSEFETAALQDLVVESVHHAFEAEHVTVSADARLDQESETDALEGWKFVLSATGQVLLMDCPKGFLLINRIVEEQTCFPCPPFYYSLDSRDNCGDDVCPERLCTRCPRGANCLGEHRFESKVAGAQWEEEVFLSVGWLRSRVYRIRACPPGTILVRSEDNPSGDECAPCPSGSYLLERPFLSHGLVAGEAVGTAPNAVDGVARWCLACPKGAICNNADGNSTITAKTGFWRQPECMRCGEQACDEDGCDPRECEACSEPDAQGAALQTAADTRQRAIVLTCPPGACKDGGCVGFNDGPVCGRCKDGASRISNQCHDCSEQGEQASKLAVAIVGGLLGLVLWAIFSWWPVLAAFAQISGSRDGSWWVDQLRSVWQVLAESKTTITIVLAGYQILATFYLIYAIRWPDRTGSFMQYFAAANIDASSLPGLNCLWKDINFEDRLLIGTLAPISGLCLHALPRLCFAIARFFRTPSAAIEDLEICVQHRFWNSLVLACIVFYPIVSVICLRSFHCYDELELVYFDFSIRCPVLERGFIFYWSLAFTMIFPVGIPIGAMVMLHHFRVPEIARQKEQAALYTGLVHYFAALFEEKYSNDSRGSTASSRSDRVWGGGTSASVSVRHGGMRLRRPTSQLSLSTMEAATTESAEIQANGGMRSVGTSQGGASKPQLSTVEWRCIERIAEAPEPWGIKKPPSVTHGTPESMLVMWDNIRLVLLSPGGNDSRARSTLFSFCDLVLELAPETLCVRSSWSDMWWRWEQRQQDLASAMDVLDMDNKSNKDLRVWLLAVATNLSASGKLVIQEPEWSTGASGAGPRDEQQALACIGSLFKQYKVRFWYWELFEMVRKLLLASVIPMLIAAESQITVGLFALLFFFSAFIWGQPYRSSFPNVLQAYIQLTLFITLYYGLQVADCEDRVEGCSESVQGFVTAIQSAILLYPLLRFIFLQLSSRASMIVLGAGVLLR